MIETNPRLPPAPTEAVRRYPELFAARPPAERRALAQIKRFMERLVADARFRAALEEHADHPLRVTRKYGIDVDPLDLLPLWHSAHLRWRKTPRCAESWPLAALWDAHLDRMITHRGMIREAGSTQESLPRFHAWRQRQIRRGASELGQSADAIVHPVIAYELSEGCSIGCWFCGISADRFAGHFPYTEDNAALWRGVLEAAVELFGPAASTGFCYWATDPMDNPDYDRFIEDHYHITGGLPQTTTAAPMKDVSLTRRVLALQRRHPTTINRFSILSVRILDRVHAEFDAEELLEVELIAQNRESLARKASAGRAAERRAKAAARGRGTDGLRLSDLHTTIACVSGFLVNMPRRTVRLVSPTAAGGRWPKGYRVYDEARFDSPGEFLECMQQMVEDYMPEAVPAQARLGFREDLGFEGIEGGFVLHGTNARYTVRSDAFSSELGALIRMGSLTSGEIVQRLVAEGADIFVVTRAIQQLFDLGFLNDDPSMDGIAPTPQRGRLQAVSDVAGAA